MRRNGGTGAMVLLVVLVAVVSTAGQAWGAVTRVLDVMDHGAPIVATALASGAFRCDINNVDPPNGPGIPQASAGIEFSRFLGLVGSNMGGAVSLGSGGDLDQVCQTFADQMSSRVRSLGCIPGPTRIFDFVGGNFTQKTWSFDIVCVTQENRVIEAIGALIVDIMTSPAAPLTLQRTGPEVRDLSSREWLRTPLQPVGEKPLGDR
jgi:hypothetical protein